MIDAVSILSSAAEEMRASCVTYVTISPMAIDENGDKMWDSHVAITCASDDGARRLHAALSVESRAVSRREFRRIEFEGSTWISAEVYFPGVTFNISGPHVKIGGAL